jgi:hypothetical protein
MINLRYHLRKIKDAHPAHPAAPHGRGIQAASTHDWVLAIRLAGRLPDGEAA